MPRKTVAALTLGGPRTRRQEPPETTGVLRWLSTEFGRVDATGTFHVVSAGGAWKVLDAEWDPIGDPVATIAEAQQRAETTVRRRLAQRTEGA